MDRHFFVMSTMVAFCAAALVEAGCTTVNDCALRGTCQAGVCVCEPAWGGPNCTQLNLLPVNGSSIAGFARNTSSSWGGSVVGPLSDGKYHMFTADMLLHCGLDTWQTNSAIAHAEAASPLGPFELTRTGTGGNGTEAILGPFSHNPTVHRAPDGTLLVFHIGGGKPRSPLRKDCVNGSTPRSEPSRRADAQHVSKTPALQISPQILSAPSADGPWTEHGTGGFASCNNPAAWIFSNGTVLLICKVTVTPPDMWRQMAVYSAPSWKGPYTFQRLTPVFGEDAFLWQSATTGTFHMVLHAMHPHKVPTSAWSEDGLEWTPAGFAGGPDPAPWAAYSSVYELSNGSQVSVARRERHQILLNAKGEPAFLYNGVTTNREDDHSFTAVQAIATAATAATAAAAA